MATIDTIFGPLDEPDDYFVLDADRRPVPATLSAYRAFTESGLAIVAETKLGERTTITTYFNGFDLDCGEEAVPYLFQTTSMIGEDGSEEDMYRTWAEALEGHRSTVERYRALLGIPDATQPELPLQRNPAAGELAGFALPAAQLSWADVQSLHD